MATISVIVPVYNKAPYLKRCFDSLARQTDQTVQVIIVNDGSTDGSMMIIEEYAKKYGWETYHTKNNGVSEARNFGMSHAHGDYIAFLDADDALTPDAIKTMVKMASSGYNIIQFGHYRIKSQYERSVCYIPPRGDYYLDHTPRYWQMVWNKLFKASFLRKHRIKFPKDMRFGEDEMFMVKCLIANGELHHAPVYLYEHNLDDQNSICRGELNLELLKGLDRALDKYRDKMKKTGKEYEAAWLSKVIERHRRSKTFRQYGFGKKSAGKYDVVYFLKPSMYNEELRYSLRSLEENWPYRDVWFYGGKPVNITPDHYVKINQTEKTKWENVRAMLREACNNDQLTEDFWLFNDDFFILQPKDENVKPQYTGSLQKRIEKVKRQHNGEHTEWTENLEHLIKTLEGAGKSTLDYAVHKPILYNRKKLLEVLDKFPDEPMVRALYGNYWNIGGEQCHDMKVAVTNYTKMQMVADSWDYLSTSDESFQYGNIGRWIRDRFTIRSRFED